jgi:hypothetical protein
VSARGEKDRKQRRFAPAELNTFKLVEGQEVPPKDGTFFYRSSQNFEQGDTDPATVSPVLAHRAPTVPEIP